MLIMLSYLTIFSILFFLHTASNCVITSFVNPVDFIDYVSIEESDVFKALSSIDTTKAKGINELSPLLVLKKCSLPLTSCITYLFNLSLSSSTIPTEWKIH